MSYFVHTKPAVAAYLAAVEGLSEAGHDALVAGYTAELGRDADDLLRRSALAYESLHFRYDYTVTDAATEFVFDFVVDGTQMAVGVVTVVFVDYTTARVVP